MKDTVYVSIDMAATGRKIDQLRKERNISVAQVVNGLGLTSPRAYYKWRAGACLPSIDNLCVLSVLLHTTIDELIVRVA